MTTTGATRLYRSRDGASPAKQLQRIHVGEGGLLEFLPDPLIPFAGARYRQETRVTLEAGAGLFWWETVMAGREARGERFQYDVLEFVVDIDGAGRPVSRERVRLCPRERPLESLERLGPYTTYTTFYICQVGAEAARWLALETALAAMAQSLTLPGEVVWGVSTLAAHGVAVRGVGRTSRALSAGLLRFWQAAKLALYGREAVPPRKVY